VAALGVAAVLVTAGCSSERPEPQAELSTAFGSLEESRAVSMTFSIDGDLEGLSGLSEGDALTQEEVDQITSSNLVIGADQGEDAESTADDAMSLDLVVDGTRAGGLRYLSDTFYLQVNADELSEKYPEIAEGMTSIEESIATTPELSTFQPLLDGEWGSLDTGPGSTFRLLLEQAGQGATMEEAVPSPEDVKALKDAFTQVGRDATVTRDEADEDHLTASVNVRQAYTTLRPVLEQQFASAGALAGEQLPALDEAPDAPLEVEVWLEDGEVKSVELDLTQFNDSPGRAVMKIDVEETDPISAPDGASEIDINALVQAMMGGGLGGASPYGTEPEAMSSL
jgi:hypothetical protein